MTEFTVRPAVSPDYQLLSSFQHSIESNYVWQMNYHPEVDQWSINFRLAHLPRPIRVDYPHPVASLLERLKNLSIFVACTDGVPVGYVSVSTENPDQQSWIKDLVVHERWRRRGCATKLIQFVNDWSMERGIHRLTLEMSSKNYPAICLADKLNFEFCGYSDFYYATNDIALFFTRSIP